MMLIGHSNGSVSLWDEGKSTEIANTILMQSSIDFVRKLPGDREVLMASKDHSKVLIVDTKSLEIIASFDFRVGGIRSISLSPNANRILVMGENGFVQLANFHTGVAIK